MKLQRKSRTWWWPILARLAWWHSAMLTHVWTTIGDTVYVPSCHDRDTDWGAPSWQARHRLVLVHERVHVRQWRDLGVLFPVLYFGPAPFFALIGAAFMVMGAWGVWLPSAAFFALSLLTAPLSVGLAYGRWWLEREAYLEEFWVTKREHLITRTDQIVEALWLDYLYTWPRAWMFHWFWAQYQRRGVRP